MESGLEGALTKAFAHSRDLIQQVVNGRRETVPRRRPEQGQTAVTYAT